MVEEGILVGQHLVVGHIEHQGVEDTALDCQTGLFQEGQETGHIESEAFFLQRVFSHDETHEDKAALQEGLPVSDLIGGSSAMGLQVGKDSLDQGLQHGGALRLGLVTLVLELLRHLQVQLFLQSVDLDLLLQLGHH